MSAVFDGHCLNKSINNVLMKNPRTKIFIQDNWPRFEPGTSPNPSHTCYRCYNWFETFAEIKEDLYLCFLKEGLFSVNMTTHVCLT
jgi:hypothetical protein